MSITVLFVDDEPDLQPLLTLKYRKELASKSWHFLFATNGHTALEILNGEATIDLLVTDINMPDMDGHTLIQQAMHLYPKMTFAILSAYDRGPKDSPSPVLFIPKPLDFKVLTDLIQRTHAAKDHFDNLQSMGV